MDVRGHDQQRSTPPCFLTLTNNNSPKLDWAMAFLVLNVATAGVYYFLVHRARR